MTCKYLHRRELFGGYGSSVSPLDDSFLIGSFKNFHTDEYSTMDNDGMCVPPLALSFAKMHQHQHIVGVVDEDGFLVLYNTHKTGRKAVIKTWQVHTNAVFDLEWLQEENRILTGSGDQTIVLHDIETCAKLNIFRGHASSVKSISSCVGQDAVFASGSRDGHVMIWDNRIMPKDGALPPVNAIYHAHTLQQNTVSGTGRVKKKNLLPAPRDAQQSVTSVLFQTEYFVVSAGAVDGCVKVWDTRKTYSIKHSGGTPLHTFSNSGPNTRRHGYTSLVLDSKKIRLYASSTDDVIYEYDMASYNPTPVKCWRGHKNSTFYVKTAVSPDDQFLLSGSSDEFAYIWQINKPETPPVKLKSHSAEVTSVAWCPNDITKLVTLSDDSKIKFWRVFCRELDKGFLPDTLGHAETRKAEKVMPPDLTTPKPKSSTPSAQLGKKSSSLNSPHASIKTWLKKSASSPTTFTQQQKIEESAISNSSEMAKLVNNSSDHKLISTASLTIGCDKSVDPNSNHITAVCLSKSSAYSDCGRNTLTSQSPRDSKPCDTLAHTASSPTDSLTTNGSQEVYNKTEVDSVSSPSKQIKEPHRHQEAENRSPQKCKRRLSADSPVCSPKRPCLTKIQSNTLPEAVSHVKTNLFSDQHSSDIHELSKNSLNLKDGNRDKWLESAKPQILSTSIQSPGKMQEVAPEADSAKSTVPVTPSLCTTDINTASQNVTPSKVFHTNHSCEVDSPTLNLPNLVLDQMTNLRASSLRKNEPNTKIDWLTQLRKDRQTKCVEQMRQTETIPYKACKKMAKISSYFKPKSQS